MVYESHAQAMKEGDMSQETVYFQKGDVTITSTRAPSTGLMGCASSVMSTKNGGC